MPAGQPFTVLCQTLAGGPGRGRADLHLHTTASDGTYSPRQVVDLARRCGLAALALTDHDTFAGLEEARRAAGGALEVISGVEITCAYRGRELHLLAYFVAEDSPPLVDVLQGLREGRRERFAEMIQRLRGLGVSVEEEANAPEALGRRYLAERLVRQGQVGSVREAFARWLADGKPAFVPREGVAVERALEAVRAAGGVASWAHPAYDDQTLTTLVELAGLGLGAVEVGYPSVRSAQAKQLRLHANRLGLAVSGGSDCHGPGKSGVGSITVSDEELQRLRDAARGAECSRPCTKP